MHMVILVVQLSGKADLARLEKLEVLVDSTREQMSKASSKHVSRGGGQVDRGAGPAVDAHGHQLSPPSTLECCWHCRMNALVQKGMTCVLTSLAGGRE